MKIATGSKVVQKWFKIQFWTGSKGVVQNTPYKGGVFVNHDPCLNHLCVLDQLFWTGCWK
jgi:hypothetical protein